MKPTKVSKALAFLLRWAIKHDDEWRRKYAQHYGGKMWRFDPRD